MLHGRDPGTDELSASKKYTLSVRPALFALRTKTSVAYEAVCALREFADVRAVTSPFKSKHWANERERWLMRQMGFKRDEIQDVYGEIGLNYKGADAKLREVFGKDQVTMFELAGIVGKHLG